MMTILVCGSRNFPQVNQRKFEEKLDAYINGLYRSDTHKSSDLLIISGGAAGPDSWVITYARKRGVHYAVIPALWDSIGLGAGPIRNSIMAALDPTITFAFWDERSRGTKDMIDKIPRERRIVYNSNMELMFP